MVVLEVVVVSSSSSSSSSSRSSSSRRRLSMARSMGYERESARVRVGGGLPGVGAG